MRTVPALRGVGAQLSPGSRSEQRRADDVNRAPLSALQGMGGIATTVHDGGRVNRYGTVLATLCLAGCASAQQREPQPEIATAVASVQVAPRGASRFVPAVPATALRGVCGAVPAEALEPGQHSVTLASPNETDPIRTVALTFNSAGELLHYLDSRGSSQLDESSPRTTIMLNFQLGTGLAINGSLAEPGDAAMGAVAEMLTLQNLGAPQSVIEAVLQQCGKPMGK